MRRGKAKSELMHPTRYGSFPFQEFVNGGEYTAVNSTLLILYRLQDFMKCHPDGENLIVVQCPREAEIEIQDRFLHVRSPTPFEAFVPFTIVPKMETDDKTADARSE